jgi:predicted nucleic acid-binding protein
MPDSAPVVIVTDTSPIRALDHLGLVHLIEAQYGTILLPPAVARELTNPPADERPVDIARYPYLLIRKPAGPLPPSLTDELDTGEAEAIHLAQEVSATLLVVDERKATRIARGLGLATIGVIGVLLEAKRAGRIEHVVPLVDELVDRWKFFASSELRREIARLAGE